MGEGRKLILYDKIKRVGEEKGLEILSSKIASVQSLRLFLA